MSEELHLFCGGNVMGQVLREPRRNKLLFRYEQAWQSDPDSVPLSLSMPLTATEHRHDVIEPFLWGLLPDNDGVLRRWGTKFQVSPKNAFALLSHVGEDCAGGIQFVRSEKVESWKASPPKSKVDWLSQGELNERMELLLRDHAATRSGSDLGQFSLAGAQPKIALFYDERKKRWGIPSGSTPTTHILKPATGAFDGLAENEHFCLRLAQECGFATASSRVEYFGECPVIVVERYDRLRQGNGVLRTDLTHLTYERALLELTFIALSDFKETPLPELTQSLTHKVNAGILWYQEHLHQSPKVEDVAAVLNIFASHLRKIFIQILNESPQSVFMRLRLRTAMIMMSESNIKLEAVAEKCGYSSASHLTRAFIKEFKISPNSWRLSGYSNVFGRVETHPWLGKESWNPRKPFISTL